MTSRRIRIATAATAAALGATGLGLLAGPANAATTASTSPAPSAAAATCDKAPWEAKVQGAPSHFGAGSASGDYLWHDSAGFRLRVTHGKNHDLRVYSGQIRSNTPMRMEKVKLEKGDSVTLSKNRKEIVFVFANHGYVDGIDFHTDCGTSLQLSNLHVGNSNLSAKQVYLGHYRQHPSAVPFTVHRYRKPVA